MICAVTVKEEIRKGWPQQWLRREQLLITKPRNTKGTPHVSTLHCARRIFYGKCPVTRPQLMGTWRTAGGDKRMLLTRKGFAEVPVELTCHITTWPLASDIPTCVSVKKAWYFNRAGDRGKLTYVDENDLNRYQNSLSRTHKNRNCWPRKILNNVVSRSNVINVSSRSLSMGSTHEKKKRGTEPRRVRPHSTASRSRWPSTPQTQHAAYLVPIGTKMNPCDSLIWARRTVCCYFLRMPELPHAYASVLGTRDICRKPRKLWNPLRTSKALIPSIYCKNDVIGMWRVSGARQRYGDLPRAVIFVILLRNLLNLVLTVRQVWMGSHSLDAMSLALEKL